MCISIRERNTPMPYPNFTKKEYIQKQMEWYPNADRQVIEFIADFTLNKSRNNNDCELIRTLFMDGYCYYFAHMLKLAFQRGEVCVCAPFGHFVWVDNNIPYDIEGVSISEAEYYIPEKYLGDTVKDFLQVSNIAHHTTEEEIQQIIDNYKADLEQK